MHAYARASIALLASALSAPCVSAAPDEIEVYTDEISRPGQYGLELHMNHSVQGLKTPAYPGQTPSQHLTQITPELYYGLTGTLEAGLYLPVATDPQGNTSLNGVRARLKYIAPREAGDALFWGLNGEIGRAALRRSESGGVAELRPIIGYRGGAWLTSFNPILNMKLDNRYSHIPAFEPSVKLTHSVGNDLHAGAEYYGEYGPINSFVPANQRSHTLYGVIDMERPSYDLNLGIGRGYVNATDRWMLKAVATVPFN